MGIERLNLPLCVGEILDVTDCRLVLVKFWFWIGRVANAMTGVASGQSMQKKRWCVIRVRCPVLFSPVFLMACFWRQGHAAQVNAIIFWEGGLPFL